MSKGIELETGGGSLVVDLSPQLGADLDLNGFNIDDTNGNEILVFTVDASAVNHLGVENQATGSGPILAALGDNTDIDLVLTPKGTGKVVFTSGAAIQVVSGDVEMIAGDLRISTGRAIEDENSNQQFTFITTASAINYVQVTNAAIGNAPDLAAAGDDTDIDLVLSAKGTGVVRGVTEAITIALSDETTSIITGTAIVTMRMPYAFTLTAVRASLNTVSSSGIPTIDINEGGSTVLSTKLTIDASEKTSTTAAAPAVISDSALADDAEITFDIDVAGTGAKGLKVTLIGIQS